MITISCFQIFEITRDPSLPCFDPHFLDTCNEAIFRDRTDARHLGFCAVLLCVEKGGQKNRFLTLIPTLQSILAVAGPAAVMDTYSVRPPSWLNFWVCTLITFIFYLAKIAHFV